MSVCGSISSSLLIDCDNPIVGGVSDILYLFNFDDIASYTKGMNNVVNLITMVSGKSGYIIEGQRSSIDVKASLVDGRFFTAYNHELTFRVFSNSADIKKQLRAISGGLFVAIIENRYRGVNGASSFEILGLDAGLGATVLETNKSDSDTQGAYLVTLTSREIAKEPHLPYFYFNTSYSQSIVDINALLSTIETFDDTFDDTFL